MLRALWIAVAIGLAVVPARAGEDSDVPAVPFERYVLDNGLEVILHRDTRVPLVGVEVWYHVGSADEKSGESGFAHLYEHMFKNSQHLHGRLHYDVLEAVGAVAANASTNTDRTNYYEIVPSNQLAMALWLESDRMGYFLPGLDAPRFHSQREVVRNERRQRYDNRPYGRDRFAVAEALYQEGHPRRYLTIGRHRDIEAATLEQVRDFYRTWYVPANATLLIAGDFEVDEAKAMVQKWFGDFPTSTKPPHRVVPADPIRGPVVREIEDPFAKLRRLHYVWHSPPAMAPDDAELDIVGATLARTGSGRLYEELVVKKQLVQAIDAYQLGMDGAGEFHLIMNLRTGADRAEVERLVDEELARMAREPISERERARAIANVEASRVWGLESLKNRMSWLQWCNQYAGDPGCIPGDLQRYRDTTPEGIRAAVARWLGAKVRAEVVTMPKPPGSPASVDP